MMLTFNATNSQVTLPLFGAVDATIDWGGANASCPTTVQSVGEVTCDYDAPGVYTVSVSGLVDHYGNPNWVDATNVQNLVSVDQWGDVGLTSLHAAFRNADNLTSLPSDFPTSVTDMSYMFLEIDSNPTLGKDWNTSNVVNMNSMFYNARNFNQDISGWQTGSVTTMQQVFFNAGEFNSPLNNWDVSNVGDVFEMFRRTDKFNQPLNNWNTSNFFYMENMFFDALAFNGDVSTWNVSGINSFQGIFTNSAFNGVVKDWDVSNGIEFRYMFKNTPFNQDVTTWNTIKADVMYYMFKDTPFNYDISGWCVPGISQYPIEFALNAPIDNTNKLPVWGTCP
jgi:trimeric autotransporter adhesin